MRCPARCPAVADHRVTSRGSMPWFMQAPPRSQRRLSTIGAALLLLAVGPGAIQALEPQSGEKEAILDCERRLCTMLQQKSTAGGDLKCELSKTWARSVIKDAEQSTLKWGFGDARCSVRIAISRALITAAMTAHGKDYKLWIPPHTATCLVELDGASRTVKATLAPKMLLRDGRVEKIW